VRDDEERKMSGENVHPRRWARVAGLALCALAWASAEPLLTEWQRVMEEGGRFERLNQWHEAARRYQRALRLSEDAEAMPRLEVLSANALATMMAEQGCMLDALRYYRRSLAALEQITGRDSADYAIVQGNLANVHAEKGDLAVAEPLMRASTGTLARLVPEDDPRLIAQRLSLALLLTSLNRFTEAEALLAEVRGVVGRDAARNWEPLVIAGVTLGQIELDRHNPEQALAALAPAFASLDAHAPGNPLLLLRALILAASANARLERVEASDALWRRAIEVGETRLGAEHPTNAKLLADYSAHLRRTGRKAEARRVERRAMSALSSAARRTGWGMSVDAAALRSK
jgi:tetratricopeptide (TPR) repeat protein